MKNLNSLKGKLNNKYVILRADMDVPMDSKGKITDDSRLKAMLQTLKFLYKEKAMTIIIGHIGRPKGKMVKNLMTDEVAKRLSKLMKKPMFKMDDCIGEDVESFMKHMTPGEFVVLENLRFYSEEKNNDSNFAKTLSEYADYYVNDCFSTAHRAHASVVGIPKYIPGVIGFNVEKEIAGLSYSKNAKKPYVAILGAAKISDKIELIDALCKKVDKLLLGGAVIFTFYKALGLEIGNSLVDDSKIDSCKKLLNKYRNKLVLPVDIVIAKSLKSKAKIVDCDIIPKNYAGYDLGPKTEKLFKDILKKAKTVFWNGPLGVFENKKFEHSTKDIAQFLSKSKAVTMVGGGDTGAAINKYKLSKKFTHVSTAGGASIEFVEGKKLPGLVVIK